MTEEPIIVHLQDQTSPFVRDALGRYVSAQAQLVAQNREGAEQVQALVVQNIAASIKRKKVSTDRLINASAADGNRAAARGQDYKSGFAVGIPAHMDRSTARYWRTIEEGSEVTWKARGGMTGLELRGMFGDSIAGLTVTSWGSRALAGPKFTLPGGGTGGKIVPWSKKAVKKFNKKASKGGGGKDPLLMVVKHEIQPQHAYFQGYNQWGGGHRVRQQLHELLASLQGRGNWRRD